jgi:hypothetical protein
MRAKIFMNDKKIIACFSAVHRAIMPTKNKTARLGAATIKRTAQI